MQSNQSGLPVRTNQRPRLLTRAIYPVSKRLPHLAGSAPRSALRAQSAENQFAFANNSFTERTRGRSRHVVPFYVLNTAAAVADEVVVPHAFHIKSPGPAFDGHFTYQARLHQVPQIVISRGPGRKRIYAIHSFEDFCGRGMPPVVHQECHHGVALRSAPQPGSVQRPFNRVGIHRTV
jgi:hypothetical protein